jgi:uncharacterized protein (TIGR03663 family)
MQKAETKTKRLNAGTVFTSAFFIQHSAFILIALLALAIRLPQLGVRPMHTDEAVNAYIVGQSLAGEKYHYDPQDRHGPALVEFTLPLVRLEGAKKFSDLTEAQLRLVPVLIGSATVLLFGAAVEIFGFIPSLVAALLFACAPLPVYYSRYFIHETLFVAATLGVILSGARAWRKNSVLFAVLAGLCAALMLACKETSVLHFVALGITVVIGWRLRAPGKIPSLQIFIIAVITFFIAGILLFTWFGQDWSALADLFRALPHLAARANGEGHEKPFWYYFILLAGGASGALLLVLSISGLAVAWWGETPGEPLHEMAVNGSRGRPPHRCFLAIYAILIFAAYCIIPYKTPWLALNFWLPLSLLAGFAIEWIWFASKKIYIRAAILLGCVALGLLIAQDTQQRVFISPADEKNPYAYAHTTEDLIRLPVRLEELARQNKISNPRVAVVAADAWPLPWYLRKFSNVGFWQPNEDTGDADFFITTTDISDKLAARLQNFRPDYFGARPNVLLILWSPISANKMNTDGSQAAGGASVPASRMPPVSAARQ